MRENAAGLAAFALAGAAIGLAVGIMGIIVVLILPLPPMLLDVLLAVSIVFSVLILMTALFIQTPLEFSSFPSVLLIATMLRLALNQLAPTLRSAVLLRDIKELSYQEIAVMLDLPEGTVKSRINRGRTELARQIRRLQESGLSTPRRATAGRRE